MPRKTLKSQRRNSSSPPPSPPPPTSYSSTTAILATSSNIEKQTRVVLRQAKNIARDTTASAERSARLAEDTRQLAATTLEAVYGQGEQLNHIYKDVESMHHHIRESEGILRYLRRCFVCFSCCDGDPEKKAQRRYEERVAIEQDAMEEMHEAAWREEKAALEQRAVLGEASKVDMRDEDEEAQGLRAEGEGEGGKAGWFGGGGGGGGAPPSSTAPSIRTKPSPSPLPTLPSSLSSSTPRIERTIAFSSGRKDPSSSTTLVAALEIAAEESQRRRTGGSSSSLPLPPPPSTASGRRARRMSAFEQVTVAAIESTPHRERGRSAAMDSEPPSLTTRLPPIRELPLPILLPPGMDNAPASNALVGIVSNDDDTTTWSLENAAWKSTGEAIQKEKGVQDACLARMSEALCDMHAMAKEMSSELVRQAPMIATLGEQVEEAEMRVQGMNRHTKLKKL